MPGQVYAVASGKGGVGKTTTVVNLGVALRVDGHSVALVDADLGMANVAEFLGIDHEPTIHDVLAGEAAVEDAVAESADGFAVVPGDRSLDAYAAADPAELDAVLEHVAERYDVVLVDTGAGVGYEEVLPLGLVDGVVLVTTPDAAAAGDTRKTAQLVDRLGRTVTGVVVNRADDDADGETVADAIGADLLGVVPEDPLLTESSAAGTPVRSADPDAPSVAAFTRVAARLLGEEPEPADADGATAAADADGATAAAEGDGTTAAGGDDGASEATDAATEGADEGDASRAPTGGETAAGDVDAETSGPGTSDGPADDEAASAATEEATAAEADDGSASGADAEPDRGFVTTGSGGSADAGSDSGSDSVAETVLSEGEDAAGDEGAARSDESEDDEEEDSGGLFSWFR